MALTFAYDLVTGNTEILKPFAIASATAIEKGEVVLFTPGVGVAAVGNQDQDDPYLGVSTEAHNGVAAGRQTGAEIKVSCSPSACFSVPCAKPITATGGSVTTFVDVNLKPATDGMFAGAYIQVVACAADTAGSMVGKKIKVLTHVGLTGALTIATQPYAFAAGDTVRLFPGPLAITSFSHDLTADGTDIDFEATAPGEAIQIIEADPINRRLVIKFRLHQFTNGPKAL